MAKTTAKASLRKSSKKPAQKPLKKSPSKSAKPAKKPAKVALSSSGYWLLKSEPDCYSIESFAEDETTLWTGVRNYQARNFMMTGMSTGDRFLFYHSSAEPPAAVGIGRVVRPHCPDPTALDPKDDHYDPKATSEMPIWYCAEVQFERRLERPISLAEIRSERGLAGMALLAPGQRLSVLPVSKSEFELIVALASNGDGKD